MANPFLFEDVADYGEVTNSFNPFLCGGDEPVVDENPFLTSVSSAPGTNPFADYSWDEPAGNNPGLLTPPAITNINDPENDFIVSSDDEASKPRRPPPPRPSMAKETHDLILSVTGALKATSDDLLERIPPTRAPSPTVFADLHSPSPVPDMLGGEDNLLGLTAAQPPRPPPPRPPARPAPPAVPPAPKVALPAQPEIDLFGTPSAPQPKSTDAILNLYSQPTKPPPDLLGDYLSMEAPLFSAPLQSGIPEIAEPPVQSETVEVDVIPEQIHEEVSIFGTEPQQKQTPPAEIVASVCPEEAPPITVTEQVAVDESPAIFGTADIAHEEAPPVPAKQPISTVTPPEERPAPPPPPVKKPALRKPQSFVPSVADVYAHVVAQDSIDYSGEDPIDPYGVEAAAGEPAPQIFGVGTPAQEPQIFGVGPEVTSQSQEFAPQIIGAGPEVPAQSQEFAPQIFGVAAEVPVHSHQEFAPQEAAYQIFGVGPPQQEPAPSIFGTGYSQPDGAPNIFGVPSVAAPVESLQLEETDTFDAFSAKFDEVKVKSNDPFDAFGGDTTSHPKVADAWGSGFGSQSIDQGGFGGDTFDDFLSMNRPPVPPPPVRQMGRSESAESEDGGFNVVIKPREGEQYIQPTLDGRMPVLAPPPKSPGYADGDPKFNPFDKDGQIPALPLQQDGYPLPPLNQTEPFEGGFKRTDSQETPTTPLFDEDVSQPLEEFPRIHYDGDGWEMQLRHPNKKKITGQRFWKKIFVKLVYQGDNPVLQLFNLKDDKDPFQELPLQACYSVSEISAQQYDQFGKIFTVKLQYIFYKERPGVRPGQVTKAERITTKLSQFAAYAIQGDYQGVKEFGSDLKKLGLPVEHAPQVSQLLKLGCMSYEDLKQFSVTIEECLFRMPVHRDRALTYKMEEVQITVVDEISVEQDAYGHVEKQIARVRLFFLAFLSGMPDVELGVNDMWRQGKEVVGRHDIIPVATEEWIRLEGVEFHSCIQLDEYEKTRTIKFKPPDACYIELMRFRIRPPRNRELPLQLKAVMCVTGNKVELRADVLVPGFTSRKLGQIPCEDVMIRFPIPECWIYLFRVEKHFRYGSVKSAHRRTGKVKGIERFLGAVDNLEPHLLEVTSGQAKYEHPHRAIVWRMPRLPKEGQGAYTTHNLVCRMQLASYDQIPDKLADYAYVEFTMPATTASHTTVRSVSLVDSPSDEPPEKYVRQLARMEYRVGIEHTQGEEMASYIAATAKPAAPPSQQEPTPRPAPDSDSDSSG